MVASCLKFCRCHVVQSAVYALVLIDHINEVSDLLFGICHVAIIAQVHFLFFDGANHPFCVSIFARLAGRCHATVAALVAL